MTDNFEDIQRQLKEAIKKQQACSKSVAFHTSSYRVESKRLKGLTHQVKLLRDTMANMCCKIQVGHWYSEEEEHKLYGTNYAPQHLIYLYIKDIKQARKHLHITAYCFFPLASDPDPYSDTEYKMFYFRCTYPIFKEMFGGLITESRLEMLTREGIPMDELLRQAEILCVGAEPTFVIGSFWSTMIDECKALDV